MNKVLTWFINLLVTDIASPWSDGGAKDGQMKPTPARNAVAEDEDKGEGG